MKSEKGEKTSESAKALSKINMPRVSGVLRYVDTEAFNLCCLRRLKNKVGVIITLTTSKMIATRMMLKEASWYA